LAPITLSPRHVPLVPIGLETEWATEPVEHYGDAKSLLILPGIDPLSSSYNCYADLSIPVRIIMFIQQKRVREWKIFGPCWILSSRLTV
jgi:hypothetical protein